jgi:hypothetical protein
MKFKKSDLTRLSPRVVADYLQRRGWRHAQDVEGRGSIWLHQDEEGEECEIMLPVNRELGDFAIRMSEAIQTLGALERRDEREVYSTLAETTPLPSEIFEGEIAAEERLQWDLAEKSQLEPLWETLNESCIGPARGTLLACLAEIAGTLVRATPLTGDEEARKSAVWRSCEKTLRAAGWRIQKNVSEEDFWNAARAGDAETWFQNNLPDEPEVKIRQDGVLRDG